MEIPKIVITKKIVNLDFFENQPCLSYYELALISLDKITNKS